MGRDLTQDVKDEMLNGGMGALDNDELSLKQLGNVYAGPNRIAMEEKALENPELYRDSQIDALVEAQIKAEELAASQEQQTYTRGL